MRPMQLKRFHSKNFNSPESLVRTFDQVSGREDCSSQSDMTSRRFVSSSGY